MRPQLRFVHPEARRAALRAAQNQVVSKSATTTLFGWQGGIGSCSEQSAAKKKKKKVALWLLGELGR